MNYCLFWENNKVKDIQYRGSNKFSGVNYENSKKLWYDDGGTVVPLDDINTYEALEKRCDEYINGNVVCCRCHKVINRENRKDYERYWACVYCKNCWTKEDQENRSYDYSHLD